MPPPSASPPIPRPVTVLAFTMLASSLLVAQRPPADADPRQRTDAREPTGGVSFPIPDAEPGTQRCFDRGVAYLHAGAPRDAERCFREVVTRSPELRMGYWGLAMANVDRPGRAAEFLELALLRGKRGRTAGTRAYFDALAAFYEVTAASAQARVKWWKTAEWGEASPPRVFRRSEKARGQELASALAGIVADCPEDLESVTLLVDQRLRNRDLGVPIADPTALDARLDRVLAKHPRHPAWRHRVRLWLPVEPSRALAAAARLGACEPSTAQQWQAGGTVYAALHRHGDAAWMFEAAVRAHHAHMARFGLLPYEEPDYGRSVAALCRSLLHVGRGRRALALARDLSRLPRHPIHNRIEDAGSLLSVATSLILESCRTFPGLDLPRLVDKGLFGAGYSGAAGAAGEAREAGDRYTTVQVTGALARIDLLHGEPERGVAALQKLTAMRADLWDAPTARRIDRRLAELRALAAFRAGPRQTARELLASSGLADGQRAEVHLAMQEPQRALALLERESERRPNRARGMALHVVAAMRTGKTDRARQVFARLRVIAGRGDLELFPDLERYRRELGFPEDWRSPRSGALANTHTDTDADTNTGKRPDLDELGPARWRPLLAPGFALANDRGHEVKLAKFRGKPVLLIFYLGFGCLHCVQQLEKFHPHVRAFRAAGMPILAIGTDTVKNLRESLEGLPADERYAYTMLSDEPAETFRRYCAFDSFTGETMHGTFLVDGDGRILWQDISHAPFERPGWLLRECKRLLRSR